MKSRRYSLFLPRDLANGLMRAYWDKSHFLYSVIDRGNVHVAATVIKITETAAMPRFSPTGQQDLAGYDWDVRWTMPSPLGS
ncbi:uncharacterized protein BO96DRAFT_348808 [Aspergillus niger CBS 101883]|uniref:uncharacterized protein n=1 Tax=Aspergillus lacticoffeatus (strain CBS 101883) TaxID=1450533 RepID=UPI000D7F986F|nr:uncharacterized protein BO96DRAFT_348808 [Aspergillus niger CBS 101883]PYH51915.1 hypothetical protein BO96DRAFT_348808 [Aspergillus niger CBS 101883]